MIAQPVFLIYCHSCFGNIYELVLSSETAVWCRLDAFSALYDFICFWEFLSKQDVSAMNISPEISRQQIQREGYIWLYQSRPHPTWTLTPPLYSPVVSLTWPWLHRPSAYTQEATAPLAGCSLPLTEFSSWVIVKAFVVFKGGKCQREAFRTVWTDQTVFNTLMTLQFPWRNFIEFSRQIMKEYYLQWPSE